MLRSGPRSRRAQKSASGFSLLLFALLVAIGVGGWLTLVPYAGFSAPVLVRVAPGSSRWTIGRQLYAAGVIRSAPAFEVWSLFHPHRLPKAGTYRFSQPAALRTVFARLARGDVYTLTLTVPEGFNRFDIAQALAQQHLVSREAFLTASADPALIADLDPSATSLEGYLFPDTYHFAPGTSATEIAATMVRRFRLELARLGWPAHLRVARRGIAAVSLHDWVTLASLVEKESALPQERALIAGVFENRLRAGQPLQCDPTVIYAALVADQYQGQIHRVDLTRPSPYNTYLHAGLPSGPIANPGRVSLLAAAQPTATPYLYFVSNGSGAHRFATTLAEQNRHVALYLREREQTAPR